METTKTLKFAEHQKPNTKSKVVAKKSFQAVLKQLRKHTGIHVEKLNGGYQVYVKTKNFNKVLLLKAMNGARGYLVRYDSKNIGF